MNPFFCWKVSTATEHGSKSSVDVKIPTTMTHILFKYLDIDKPVISCPERFVLINSFCLLLSLSQITTYCRPIVSLIGWIVSFDYSL